MRKNKSRGSARTTKKTVYFATVDAEGDVMGLFSSIEGAKENAESGDEIIEVVPNGVSYYKADWVRRTK